MRPLKVSSITAFRNTFNKQCPALGSCKLCSVAVWFLSQNNNYSRLVWTWNALPMSTWLPEKCYRQRDIHIWQKFSSTNNCAATLCGTSLTRMQPMFILRVLLVFSQLDLLNIPQQRCDVTPIKCIISPENMDYACKVPYSKCASFSGRWNFSLPI